LVIFYRTIIIIEYFYRFPKRAYGIWIFTWLLSPLAKAPILLLFALMEFVSR
jgi:hypothetical protein